MKSIVILDLNTIFRIDKKVWLIDKSNALKPIIKIPLHDYELIKSGIYKKFNLKLNYNNRTYWLPQEYYDKINGYNITNLAFSMVEFVDVSKSDYIIDTDILIPFKNTICDIYCLTLTKDNEGFKTILDENLKDYGLSIKEIINVCDNKETEDKVIFNKACIILKYLFNYKMVKNKFIPDLLDENVSKTNNVSYLTKDKYTFDSISNLQKYFDYIYNNAFEIVTHNLNLCMVTNNKVNRLIKKNVTVTKPSIIKKFIR